MRVITLSKINYPSTVQIIRTNNRVSYRLCPTFFGNFGLWQNLYFQRVSLSENLSDNATVIRGKLTFPGEITYHHLTDSYLPIVSSIAGEAADNFFPTVRAAPCEKAGFRAARDRNFPVIGRKPRNLDILPSLIFAPSRSHFRVRTRAKQIAVVNYSKRTLYDLWRRP